MEKLLIKLGLELSYPKEVHQVVNETIQELVECDYFLNFFENDHKAVSIFYDRLCRSLIPKFISGEDLFWCEPEFERIINEAGVEYSIEILENLELIYVFDCPEKIKEQEKILVLRK